MVDLPTYTVPDDVYASFFYRATATVGKGPLHTELISNSHKSDLLTVSPTSPAIYIPTGIPTTPGLDAVFLDSSSVPTFEGVRAQATEIPISSEAQNFPVFRTSPPQPSYSPATQIDGDRPISPVAIIGLATGGAISVLVALAMAIYMCTRRRHSSRYRQNSITSSDRPMEITVASSRSELSGSKERCHEWPSSLKSSPSDARPGSNRSRRSKHITWKDQVFSDQSFITLPPLPTHQASISLPSLPREYLRAGEEPQELHSSSFSAHLPPRPDRISYRSLSSPALGADCTSIYSSVPPSPICVSALSPIPSYLFSAPHHRLQRPQILSSQFNPKIASSNELSDYYATITCTSIYSFLPGAGCRPLSDSFVIQEPNSPNPTRKSSNRYSGNIPAFHPSFAHLKSLARLPNSAPYASQANAGRGRMSAFIITKDIDNDGDSISSVSSTSSSILDYRAGGTPRKLLTDGLLAIGSSSSPSSAGAFYYSPPSGGLTSPSHRRLLGGGLALQTSSPLSSRTLDGPDSPQTPGSGIGIALSPPLFGATFAAASAPKHMLQDVFCDTSDIDTGSPTLEEISTRHFSCSMPTRPRPLNVDSLVPPSPTRTTSFLDFCGRDSPTLPRDLQSPGIETEDSECDIFEIPQTFSRRMHGGVESTYSPTLSMVNFYTMGNRVDSRFSSVNFLSSFSSNQFPGPYHARSSSVPSPISPIMNYRHQSQDDDWKREPLIQEYPPNSPEERLDPLSLSLDSTGRTGIMDFPGIGENAGNGRRYSSQIFSTPGRFLVCSDRVDNGAEDGELSIVDVKEMKVRRTQSID